VLVIGPALPALGSSADDDDAALGEPAAQAVGNGRGDDVQAFVQCCRQLVSATEIAIAFRRPGHVLRCHATEAAGIDERRELHGMRRTVLRAQTQMQATRQCCQVEGLAVALAGLQADRDDGAEAATRAAALAQGVDGEGHAQRRVELRRGPGLAVILAEQQQCRTRRTVVWSGADDELQPGFDTVWAFELHVRRFACDRHFGDGLFATVVELQSRDGLVGRPVDRLNEVEPRFTPARHSAMAAAVASCVSVDRGPST